MNKLVLLILMFIITFLSTEIFMILDYKYDIRIKYFSFVAKNKILFYIFLILWIVILVPIILVCNNYYIFLILVLYLTLFLNFYHRVRNWRFAYKVYIENIDLLKKSKEKIKNRKK